MKLTPLAALLLLAVPTIAETRVYITDSNSWEMQGGFAASNRSGGGGFAGGARPQTGASCWGLC